MAKKKRKAGKAVPDRAEVRGPGATSGRFSRWENFGLPALGVLALVFAWLAVLGGVSDGSIDWRHLFDPDIMRSFGVFRDLFLDDGYPASGWTLGKAPGWFPDWAFQWPLFALGIDLWIVLYLFPLLQVGFAAAGWILVCDFLFGKSPARRAAVLALHGATFLLLGWRESHLFILQMETAWHYGAWACLPWLLWLSLRLLDGCKGGIVPKDIAALTVATAIVAASDMVIVPWFVAPAALLAPVFASRRGAAILIATFAAGVALGRLLYHNAGFQNPRAAAQLVFDPSAYALTFRRILSHLGDIASRDPLEFAAGVLFLAATAYYLARVSDFRRGKGKAVFRPVPFVLWLIPASMAISFVALVVYGYVDAAYQSHPVKALRHALPLIYFPLFVGFALLPWTAFPRSVPAMAAACVAAIAFAVPKLAAIDPAAADPYATPFQQCFAENAARLGWTGGIAAWYFALPLLNNPNAEMENYIKADVRRFQESGRSFVEPTGWGSNYHRFSGEFQFVVVNAHNGRVFGRPPRAGDRGCPSSDFASCIAPHPGPFVVIDDRAARGAFGEPAEVVECAGIGLYHYDPPLRFDFPENPVGQIVGRKF